MTASGVLVVAGIVSAISVASTLLEAYARHLTLRRRLAVDDPETLTEIRLAWSGRGRSKMQIVLSALGTGAMFWLVVVVFGLNVRQPVYVALLFGTGLVISDWLQIAWSWRRMVDADLPEILRERGRCGRCGYLLVDAGRCPECGDAAVGEKVNE